MLDCWPHPLQVHRTRIAQRAQRTCTRRFVYRYRRNLVPSYRNIDDHAYSTCITEANVYGSNIETSTSVITTSMRSLNIEDRNIDISYHNIDAKLEHRISKRRHQLSQHRCEFKAWILSTMALHSTYVCIYLCSDTSSTCLSRRRTCTLYVHWAHARTLPRLATRMRVQIDKHSN